MVSILAGKKKSQSKRAARMKPVEPVTARDVLALLGRGPMGWRELVTATRRETPQEIKQLRQMLKGLERSGEVRRDHTGAYHADDPGADVVGIVIADNNRLFVEGAALDPARRQSVRPGDRVVARIVDGQARVVDVVAYSDEPLIGILRWRGRHPYVESLGAQFKGRVSLLAPPTDRDARDGDTVSVKILDRDRRGLVGEFHQLLVSDSVVDQAIRTTIAAMGIPDEWPDGVARAVAKLPKSVAGDRHPERRDLRDVPLVTIDGETAKDFDDAVYAEPAAEGWRLIVAIADVGHYVKPGSPLDQEAQLRGTSVYFPGFVVPMLPEALSNELCSLRPEVARLALVCDMRVAVDGDVVDHEFFEATIRSHARLTYNNVQDFFDGDAGDVSSAVAESLHTLLEVHRALRGARERRGGLDFETREGEIVIRDGRVCAVEPARRLSTHQLIEEAMIAANVAAAEFLEENESLSLYRVHEAPEVLKLDELRQALAVVGVQLPPGRADPKALQTALAGLAGQAHAWLYEQMVLRSMQQAVYSPVNQGHFGLALERYMHFTSPIRRYPDLLVHRAIKAVLKDKRDRRHLPDLDRLHLLGESCSHTERRAESAGWAVDAWLKCDLLQQRIGEVFEGLVAGVTDFGLFVDIEGYYVQGLLHVSELGNDYYHYNAQTASLIGEKSGRRFRLGDTLEVRVVDVDPPQGKIDLRLPVGDGGAARKRRTVKGRRG